MNNIKISLCAAALRPESWIFFYNSLLSNTIEFEVIFVGPNNPNFKLPNNFIHIQSNVKPAQCYEIAFREAKGELIHWTADDAIYSSFGLDKIYAFWKSFNSDLVATSFKTIEDNIENNWQHRFFSHIPDSPLMAPFGFISRKIFNELGGYDKNFICGQSENDVLMRFYELGGKLIPFDMYINIYHQKYHTSPDYPSGTAFRSNLYFEDRKALENAWVKDGVLSKKRLIPFEGFSNENILTITQGGKGKWI